MKNNPASRAWLSNKPLIISGPCSAESEHQMLEVAQDLKQYTDTTVLRAGIWKPRTTPGNFEGVGEVGLVWLKKAKALTGLLTATEVANAEHVRLALKHDVDILWIGARTTVSPFAIQEIAEALNGTDKIVLIKNPVSTDVSLWAGAFERFYAQDVKNLGAIHRGYTPTAPSAYRNNPVWSEVTKLREQYPFLPIICDPSHMAGNTELLPSICQTALNLNYDGFMIEAHPNPSKALTDASQQVTPIDLGSLLSNLVVKTETTDNVEYHQQIETLRTVIDDTDTSILEMLAQRTLVASEIGKLKRENNVTTLQVDRWTEVKASIEKQAKALNLDVNGINSIYDKIHTFSLTTQQK